MPPRINPRPIQQNTISFGAVTLAGQAGPASSTDDRVQTANATDRTTIKTTAHRMRTLARRLHEHQGGVRAIYKGYTDLIRTSLADRCSGVARHTALRLVGAIDPSVTYKKMAQGFRRAFTKNDKLRGVDERQRKQTYGEINQRYASTYAMLSKNKHLIDSHYNGSVLPQLVREHGTGSKIDPEFHVPSDRAASRGRWSQALRDALDAGTPVVVSVSHRLASEKPERNAHYVVLLKLPGTKSCLVIDPWRGARKVHTIPIGQRRFYLPGTWEDQVQIGTKMAYFRDRLGKSALPAKPLSLDKAQEQNK